jgi:hypothetical protein
MRLVCLLLAIGACKLGGSGDDYYVEPGGPSNGMMIPGTPTDAAPDDTTSDSGDGAAPIQGTVCDLNDLRDWDTCSPIDYSSMMVLLGTSTAAVSSTGTFDIATPPGTPFYWTVEGPAELAITPFGTAPHLVYSMKTSRYQDLALAQNIQPEIGTGQVFLRVRRGTGALADATGAIVNQTAVTRYDTNDSEMWDTGQTSTAGVMWFPNVPAGTASITVTPPTGNDATFALTVGDQATTFATVEVP